jgi:hypothetical protein
MNIAPFDDPYHTPASQVGPVSRFFPSVAFYARTFAIVCEAAWRTRRGYSMAQWAADSRTFMRRAEASGVRYHIENASAYAVWTPWWSWPTHVDHRRPSASRHPRPNRQWPSSSSAA